MYDWTETSIDHIREADFPIRCERCDHDLTGLGESGICPACGVSFSRRQRLWHTYGPEAFAKPPITPAEQDAQRKDTGFLAGLLAGVVVTLFLSFCLYSLSPGRSICAFVSSCGSSSCRPPCGSWSCDTPAGQSPRLT